MRVNHKSDFDFLLAIPSADGAQPFPDVNFIGRLTTSGSSNVYVFCRKGDEYTNCLKESDGIHVVCNNHSLGTGRLSLELSLLHPNSLYPDGVKKEVVTQRLDIELVSDIGDESAIKTQFVCPYIFVKDDGSFVAVPYDGSFDSLKEMITDLKQSSAMTSRLVEDTAMAVADSQKAIGATLQAKEDAVAAATEAKNMAEEAARIAAVAMEAIEKAFASAEMASDAAEKASDAAEKANVSAKDTVRATESANSAMQSAQTAAERASAAAVDANQAAESASEAAENANSATSDFENKQQTIDLLEKAVYPLQIVITAADDVLEYDENGNSTQIDIKVKRYGHVLDDSDIESLRISVNGTAVSLQKSADMAFKVDLDTLGANRIVVEAEAFGLTSRSEVVVRVERPIYIGFNQSPEPLVTILSTLDKRQAKTSSAGVYHLVNKVADGYLWLCVPSYMAVSMVEKGNHRISMTRVQVYSDYTFYRSVGTFTEGFIDIQVESYLI